MVTVVVGKTYPMLPTKRRKKRGGAPAPVKLSPIKDILGRPLRGPVGSPEAEQQMREATQILREREAPKVDPTPLPAQRTISYQLQEKGKITPTPSQIGLPYPREERRRAPRISYWEGVKGAGSAIVYDVKQLLTGKPIKEWKDPAEAFRLTAPLKEEKVAYLEPQLGTSIKAYKPITYGKIQKDIEIKRTLAVGEERYKAETDLKSYFAGLQKKIDVGETPFEKATALGKIKEEAAQKEFQSKVETIYKKYPDVKGIGRRTSPILTGARAVKDIAIYSTPLTATMALGMETKKAPLIIEDVSKGVPTYMSFKPTTGMFVSGTIVGLHAGGLVARSTRAMTLGRIESAMEATPIKVSGKRYFLKGGEKVMDVGKWKAYGDYSVAKGTTILVSEVSGKKIVTKGISEVQVMTKTYGTGRPFVVGAKKSFEIESKVLPKTSGVYPSVSKMKTTPVWEYSLMGKGKDFLKGVKFKGKAYTSAPSKETLLGGVAARKGGYIIGKSGEIKEAYYYYMKGKGFRAGQKIDFRFPEQTWSVLKEVKPKIKEDITMFKSTIGKPSTPLSKTFAEPKAIAPTKLKGISPTKLKGVTKQTYSSTMIPPSTAIKQVKGVIGKVSTKQLTRTIPKTTTTMASISKQMSEQQMAAALVQKPRASLAQISIPKLKESLISGTSLRSGQKQLQQQITSPALITAPTMAAPSIKLQFRMPFVPVPFVPLILPIGARLGLGVKWRGTQLGKQPTQYQPSFTALVLGIKAPKIPAAYRAGAGGLIIRPIITKKKTKRRKKK